MQLTRPLMIVLTLMPLLAVAQAAEDTRVIPELKAPRSARAVPGGDLAKVDWSQAGVLAFRSITGQSCARNMEARLLHDGEYLYVRFQDTGIDADKLPMIFKPYYSSRPKGSGLGLPTARKIIEAHNGTIAVTSEPEKGTLFTIKLPLHA